MQIYRLTQRNAEVHALRTCEKYSMAENKWSELPPLITGRCVHGAVLIESKKAFCFCGYGVPNNLNALETL